MGKKRKSGGGTGSDKSGKKGREMGSNQESSLLDPSSRGFVFDEVDDYEDERDRLALSRAQALMARPRAPREQVLGIDMSSSDDEAEEEEESDQDAMYMEDDIVEEEKEQLPDERAWGSHKWRYIGTDTTDEKIHKMAHVQDEEMARLEEEAARKLQERMAAELEDLVVEDLLPQETNKEKKRATTDPSVTVDLSRLSRTKKLQLLKRESPEFLPLLEDFREKLKELRTSLVPLMQGVKDGNITNPTLCHYITAKYRLVLNYVCVLSVYMTTKSSVGAVGQHPVVGRLAQYRQLLQELIPCDEKLQPQLKDLLPKIKAAVSVQGKSSKKPRQLQLLIGRRNKTQVKKRKLPDLDDAQPNPDSKPKGKKELRRLEAAEASSDEDQQSQAMLRDEGRGEEEVLDSEGKRAITYQIAKNKGLTPSRKKEQRNPRVKYRRKYQTKLKKRKGQVRLVRKEMKRYEGEVSGIKAHTIKSRKIG